MLPKGGGPDAHFKIGFRSTSNPRLSLFKSPIRPLCLIPILHPK